MLDHIFLTVADLERSIAFYEKALAPLGIEHAIDYDGKDGPEGHPDLKGFGRDNRVSFWLRKGSPEPQALHVGFVARSETEVQAFYRAAMAAGASDNGKPGARLHYDPRYYAANVLDPDGYSLEAVYKSWQHPQPMKKKNKSWKLKSPGFNSVEEYLASVDAVKERTLRSVIDFILAEFPELESKISWNVPAIHRKGKYVAGICAYKHHLTFSPWSPRVIRDFKVRLAKFVVFKNCFQIPVDWKIDKKLVKDLVRARLAELD